MSTVRGSQLDFIPILFMDNGDASDLRMRGSPGVVLVLANCGGDRGQQPRGGGKEGMAEAMIHSTTIR